ncbi:unnamed protein product [Parascedosporium putredinis]|uniref:Uncharacterized protein n=1 Tax=Parascedosporium putredinis TaxID=1442378 RepID=A0A9P1M746_9PEZI|nr:unnamed protein product [Parascedosporium putredinis]CAI7987313.1 unnamed protein product [Parascedosporium putredinis]
MDSSWGWLEPRSDELWARQFGNGFGGNNNNGNDDDSNNSNNGNGFNNNGTGNGFRGFGGRNQTNTIINQFRFQAAKSIRTSTIILSVFNVVAAAATAVGILWDGYATAKRNDPKYKFRTSAFNCVGPAEAFPLILSCGIVIQGIVFAVAQSTGLRNEQVLGCTIVSQMMLPAVFIVPYIQLIFGVEVAIRAFRRRNPFPPRTKWNVIICLALVGTLLLATYLVTHFRRPPNFCFASLFWFVQMYAEGCFAVLTIIGAALLAATVVIFVKLHRNAGIDPTERIASSRMVYYLAVGFISALLIVPFFFVLAFQNRRDRGVFNAALQLSMVSSVVANVSGLMTGGLHLFLRSTTMSTIGPREKDGKYEEDRRKSFKRGIRVWTSREDPAPGPSVNAPTGLRRMNTNDSFASSNDDRDSYYGDEKKEPWEERINPFDPMPHTPKNSYSLFPNNNANLKAPTLLPATTYDPNIKETMVSIDTLKPPAPIHGFRHRRDSSLASHATVQIGLRLSNMEDMPPLNSKYFQDSKSQRPSPLSNVAMSFQHPNDRDDRDDDSVTMYVGDGSIADNDDRKTLSSTPEPEKRTDCTLSPAVYKPPESPKKAKVTSPRGVGFTLPQQRGQLSPQSPSSGSRDQTPAKKSDWI